MRASHASPGQWRTSSAIRTAVLLVLLPILGVAVESIPVPVLEGGWWKIGDKRPDLGEWSSPKEDACDFTIFRSADGAWQAVGCVRGAAWPTGERVFHRWESAGIRQSDWTPQGVFSLPDASLNQLFSIQAPHCFVHDGVWYMFYNASTGFGRPVRQGNAAYAKTSTDGRTFRDLMSPGGEPWHFPMGRDINVFFDAASATWFAYYAGKAPPGTTDERMKRNGAMVYRRASALTGPWSEEVDLGLAGNPESPFVVAHAGRYYLWQQMTVYVSDRPDRFTGDPVCKMTPGATHGYYAPEIIRDGDAWYVAAYINGLWMCRLRWEDRPLDAIAAWQAGPWVGIRTEEENRP